MLMAIAPIVTIITTIIAIITTIIAITITVITEMKQNQTQILQKNMMKQTVPH